MVGLKAISVIFVKSELAKLASLIIFLINENPFEWGPLDSMPIRILPAVIDLLLMILNQKKLNINVLKIYLKMTFLILLRLKQEILFLMCRKI